MHIRYKIRIFHFTSVNLTMHLFGNFDRKESYLILKLLLYSERNAVCHHLSVGSDVVGQDPGLWDHVRGNSEQEFPGVHFTWLYYDHWSVRWGHEAEVR